MLILMLGNLLNKLVYVWFILTKNFLQWYIAGQGDIHLNVLQSRGHTWLTHVLTTFLINTSILLPKLLLELQMLWKQDMTCKAVKYHRFFFLKVCRLYLHRSSSLITRLYSCLWSIKLHRLEVWYKLCTSAFLKQVCPESKSEAVRCSSIGSPRLGHCSKW